MPRDAATTDPLRSLYVQAVRAMIVGLTVNLLLAVVKVVAGVMSNSIAMIADAANSVGDALTSSVTIYALHYAQKPPDDNHPYGHSRIESVAALTVAVLIGASALVIAIEALRSLPSLHEIPPAWVLWVAAANVVIKEGVFRYKRAVSLRTGSQAVLANAWDHRADALCSAAVFIGLLAMRLGGPPLIWADEFAALFVAAFIIYSSVKLYRQTASVLLDEQCDPTTTDAIRAVAQSTPGVVEIEQLRARKSGLEVLVDIHVEVDADESVRGGHRIGHNVQKAILSKITSVTQVLVHVEPADTAATQTRAT